MRGQKGQGMIEFLLVIPALVGLVLLVVDGAYLMWVLVSSRNAVAEGGRAAQVWEPNIQGVTCLQDTVAAIDRVSTFPYTLELSDNCRLAGSLDRIGFGEPIHLKVVVDHTPIMSMPFFRTPPVIHLPAEIIVNHE